MKNVFPSIFKCITVVLPLLFASQCEVKNPMAEERRNIICFVDLSASVSPTQKNNYSKAIEEVLRNMSANDKIVCYPIDAGSYTNPVKIFNEDFAKTNAFTISFPEAFNNLSKTALDSILPPFKREGETFLDEEKQVSRINNYINRIVPFIKNRLDNVRSDKLLNQHSDIIHCILNSEKDIEMSSAFDLHTTNYFIFLSDMIHDDGTINFDRPYGITREEGEKVLQNLKSINMIPDLKGARIIVIGRSTGSMAKTPEALESIKTFWGEYFSPKYANGSNFKYAGADAISDIPALLKPEE